MERNSERTSTPVDKFVGGKVRERRTELKVSQERLAEVIDISVQQLQKYESGANRIGASRLFSIAEALDKPIGFFFGEDDAKAREDPTAISPLADALTDEAAFEIIETFSRIEDHNLRRQVVDVLVSYCAKARRDLARPPRKKS